MNGPESWFFTADEMRCKCGCGLAEMDRDFMRRLNCARLIDGQPWPVNSAFRCADHNANVGGAVDSAHPRGLAVDIRTPNKERQWDVAMAARDAGFRRVEFAADWHVHIDDDPAKAAPLTRQAGAVWVEGQGA